MTEYYAVIEDLGRTGPFASMHEASAVLKDASKARGHTEEEATRFFLHESSVVEVKSRNGQLEFFNVGWVAREQSGREDSTTDTEDAAERLCRADKFSPLRKTDYAA